MCAKLQLGGQTLAPEHLLLLTYFSGPYDSVSLRVLLCIRTLCDGLVLYRANRKTKQSIMMQFSVFLEQHINIVFYSFQAIQ